MAICQLTQKEKVLFADINEDLVLTNDNLSKLNFEISDYIDNNKYTILNLNNVSKIDSSGIGILVACYKHATQNNKKLILLKPSDNITKLFKSINIDKVIEYHDSNDSLLNKYPSFNRYSKLYDF